MTSTHILDLTEKPHDLGHLSGLPFVVLWRG
jgi:hypothetical protein